MLMKKTLWWTGLIGLSCILGLSMDGLASDQDTISDTESVADFIESEIDADFLQSLASGQSDSFTEETTQANSSANPDGASDEITSAANLEAAEDQVAEEDSPETEDPTRTANADQPDSDGESWAQASANSDPGDDSQPQLADSDSHPADANQEAATEVTGESTFAEAPTDQE